MKKKLLLTIILVIALTAGAEAQQTNRGKTNKGKKTAIKQTASESPLPPRCADCFFAAPLQVDIPFGPTEPPRGYGFVSEIRKDAKVKTVFDQEHNSVWYILTIPYDGKLCIDVTPKSSSDDYDLLIYKYTNKYFCNRVIGNKVTPVRSILSTGNSEQGGKTGIDLKGTLANIPKSSSAAYGMYIDVKTDEKYVIVVDNVSDGGLGHTILATVNTNFAPLTVLPIDSTNRERTTANILVKDSETDKVVLEKADAGAQRLKILPNKLYSISLKKEGYFNYLRAISHAQAIKDSILTARLVAIKVGSNLPIRGELYFDVDEQNNVTILPESYPALDDVVKTLQDYPRISVEVIGRITTEGYNIKKDAENSRLRATAIKNYLIGRGIPEANIIARGSYIKELEKQLASQKKIKSGGLITPSCEIKIIKTK
ncbi:MAG: OmpA family protein [Bacteroidales bacterium]|jgi:outer membrane protein OmpA-like peptidoglycan-associated protein